MRFADEDLTGFLCFSLAGHDKGSVYVITDNSSEYAHVADGRLKTVSSPKKKNIKHLQLVKKLRLSNSELNDTDIKRAIKLFLKEGKEAD